MNEKLLRKIARFGDRHPDNFDMGNIAYTGDCGAVGCFIGWETLLHHHGSFKIGLTIDVSLLNFDEETSKLRLQLPNTRLFFAWAWPRRLLSQWGQERVTLLSVVDDYIANDGWATADD